MRLIVFLLLCASLARADRAGQITSAGDDAFQHGLFADALAAYDDAYLRTHEPVLLLKAGICLEKLGRLAEAADRYRRYLADEPSLSAGDREGLSKKADALSERSRPPPSPAPAAVPPASALPVTTTAPPVLPRHFVRLRRAVVGSAVASAVMTLAAGAVTIAAAEGFSRLNADCRVDASGCSGGARDRVAALDHTADALWALSAAGAIAALTLHLVLRHERRIFAGQGALIGARF